MYRILNGRLSRNTLIGPGSHLQFSESHLHGQERIILSQQMPLGHFTTARFHFDKSDKDQ